MNDYLFQYYQAIENGSVVVGKWVRLVYERIIEGINDKTYTYDLKKAHKAIKFIENFCHHCEGRDDLLKLELWQKAFISALFGIMDSEGHRQFREAILVVSRKNGKSLLASAIANYCLFLDGEYGAKIFCVAPKLDQADIIYNDIWQTVSSEAELKSLIKRRKTDYYVESTNSSVKKIAFNHKKSDGFNPSLVICDEVASWRGDSGLKQYEVMKSSFGSRLQPILLSCTTSGYESDGIYDELIKRGTSFLLGTSKETRLLPVFYMIDDIEKWNDITELRKSNPNMSVSVSPSYLLEEIAVAEQSLSKKGEFLTKYCNIKQNSSLAWLSASDIAKCCREHLDLNDFRDSYCVGGIDLSQTTDLTACSIVILKNGTYHIFTKFFLPSEKIEEATARDGIPYRAMISRGILQESGENIINYADCFDWFRMLVEEYRIYPLKVGYDRYSSQYLIQDMEAYGFHTDDVYQGDNLYPILLNIEGLIKDGKINIGDNDLLKAHFLNSAIKMNQERGRGRLVKINPNDHIDGMASVSDAFTMISKYWDEIGTQLMNEG